MALYKYNKTITRTMVDGGSIVVPLANVKFYAQSGAAPVVVYSDAAGENSLGNEVQADANGFVGVFLKPGVYKVVATKGLLTITLEHELAVNVAAVLAGGFVSDLITVLPSIYSFYDIKNNVASFAEGQRFDTTGYHPDTTVGGGPFVWKPDEPKANHNGGTIHSPTVPSPDLQAGADLSEQLDAYLDGTGEEDPGGDGCFVMRDTLGFFTVDQFGGDPLGVVDSSASTDALAASYGSTGGPIKFGRGTYSLREIADFVNPNNVIVGEGRDATVIEIDHLETRGIIFRRQFSGFVGVTLKASSARKAGGLKTDIDVLFEAEDVPDDPSIRMRQCLLEKSTLTDAPGHAVVLVGPVLDGTRISQCRIFNNGGHAIAVDRGFLTGRTNKPDPLVPGLITILDCLSFANGGHAIAAGHPDDTISTPALRLVVTNLDSGQTATDAAVRYSEEDLYIDGTNHVLSTITTSRSGSGGSIRISGRNNHITDIRAINCDHTVRVANRTELPTDGIYVTGITALTKVQSVAVIIESGAKNVTAHSRTRSNITALVTPLMPGTELINPVFTLRKSSDQVVNNSTAFVDITGLSYRIAAGETIRYKMHLLYTGPSAADIKFTTGGTGAAYHRFGVSGGIKIGADDVVTVDSMNTSFGDPVVLGSASSERSAVIEGYLEQSTEATIAARFAQLTATVGDTVVLRGSTMEIQRVIS